MTRYAVPLLLHLPNGLPGAGAYPFAVGSENYYAVVEIPEDERSATVEYVVEDYGFKVLDDVVPDDVIDCRRQDADVEAQRASLLDVAEQAALDRTRSWWVT